MKLAEALSKVHSSLFQICSSSVEQKRRIKRRCLYVTLTDNVMTTYTDR
jgi:hypothetical protein